MWHLYHSVTRTVMRSANGWDMQEWLFVFLIAVALGAFFLKGFGSRKNY